MPPAALECELRVVVWSLRELVLTSANHYKNRHITAEGGANVFVTVQAGHGPVQESDVHAHAHSDASFNYRYLFDVGVPTRHTKLLIQVWDTRATGPNDALAECTLQLADLYVNARKAAAIHDVPRQWYTCTHPLYAGQQCKVDLSLSMMPRAIAEELENICALGRSVPNQNPYLPPPTRAGGTLQLHATRIGTKLGRRKEEPRRPRTAPAAAAEPGAAARRSSLGRALSAVKVGGLFRRGGGK